MSRRALRYAAGIVWLGAAGAGLAGLWRYSAVPGVVLEAKGGWPAESGLRRPAGHFNVVMFLHPECPCSRASVEELGVLLARCPGKILPQVVFFTPEDQRTDWGDSRLRRQAGEIPGVAALTDINGREAGLFGARLSGETFVYDPEGALVFHGGITAARGHSGDNDGLGFIETLVNSGTDSHHRIVPERSPVYGCPLPEAVLESPFKHEPPTG